MADDRFERLAERTISIGEYKTEIDLARAAIAQWLPAPVRTILRVPWRLLRSALSSRETQAIRKSRTFRAERNFDAAEAEVSAALAKRPNSHPLAIEHAEIASARRDWMQARKRWQEVLEHSNGRGPALAYLKLARACRNLRDLDAAETAAIAGLASAPDSTDLAVESAEIAFLRRDWDEAALRWQTVVDRYGNAAPEDTFLKLSHAQLFQGDLEAAWAALRQGGLGHDGRSDEPRQLSLPANEKGRLEIAIKCAAREREKEWWGDYHFAKSLAKALERLGHRVRIDLYPNWNAPESLADDVAIVLRGLKPYIPRREQMNICWLISHPELCEDTEMEFYDRVFVASASYADVLRKRLSTPVSALLQCSDPNVFRPITPPALAPAEDLLFVGNSRGQRRKIVLDAVAEKLPLAVYGRGWNNLIPQSALRGEAIANSELHAHYAAAKIVLNDHWPDMAANGFVSNRLFDIALSGGFAISDGFVGAELFEGDIVTYETAEELRMLYERWHAADEDRREMASRLRELVLARHTFDHRAAVLHQALEAMRHSKAGGPRRS